MKIPSKCLPPFTRKLFTRKLEPLPTYMTFPLCVMICLPVVFAHADKGIANADTERLVRHDLAKRIVSIRPVTGGQGFKVHIIADGIETSTHFIPDLTSTCKI